MDVLIVEDEPVSRRALTLLMTGMGYETFAAVSAEDAIEAMRFGGAPRVALVDLNLPGMSGYELICRLERFNPDVVSVLITAAAVDVVEGIRRRHPINYLAKPVDFDELLTLLRSADIESSN